MFHFNFLDRKVGRPSSLELQQQQQQYHSGAAVKATSDQGAGFGRWGFRDEFVCRPDYHPTAIAIMSANAGDLRTILARGGIPLGGSMCPVVASGEIPGRTRVLS